MQGCRGHEGCRGPRAERHLCTPPWGRSQRPSRHALGLSSLTCPAPSVWVAGCGPFSLVQQVPEVAPSCRCPTPLPHPSREPTSVPNLRQSLVVPVEVSHLLWSVGHPVILGICCRCAEDLRGGAHSRLVVPGARASLLTIPVPRARAAEWQSVSGTGRFWVCFTEEPPYPST